MTFNVRPLEPGDRVQVRSHVGVNPRYYGAQGYVQPKTPLDVKANIVWVLFDGARAGWIPVTALERLVAPAKTTKTAKKVKQ